MGTYGVVVNELARGICDEEVREDVRLGSAPGTKWILVGVSILFALMFFTKFCLLSFFMLLYEFDLGMEGADDALVFKVDDELLAWFSECKELMDELR